MTQTVDNGTGCMRSTGLALAWQRRVGAGQVAGRPASGVLAAGKRLGVVRAPESLSRACRPPRAGSRCLPNAHCPALAHTWAHESMAETPPGTGICATGSRYISPCSLRRAGFIKRGPNTGEENDQVDRCWLCLGRRKLCAGHVTRAASSAGQYDHASPRSMRRGYAQSWRQMRDHTRPPGRPPRSHPARSTLNIRATCGLSRRPA